MIAIKGLIYIWLFLLFSACSSESTLHHFEPEHYGLNTVLDHLPFDQFNEYSNAIFRDGNGKFTLFRLNIDEDLLNIFTGKGTYSTNQITFRYRNDFSFEIPQIEVIAKIDSLPEVGFIEHLICRAHVPISSIVKDKLTIIPGLSYQTTVLNEEFTWLGETFDNVYSNVLIEENTNDKVKIFYQSSIGIIGFTDETGKSWVFDHFE